MPMKLGGWGGGGSWSGACLPVDWESHVPVQRDALSRSGSCCWCLRQSLQHKCASWDLPALLEPRAWDVVAELGRPQRNPTVVPARAGCLQPSHRVHTQMGSINTPSPEEI